MSRALLSLGRGVLDVLLPPGCAQCHAPVARHGQLCAACFQSLTFITEPLCRSCGLPFATKEEAGRRRFCQRCDDHPPVWREARGALLYTEASKHLLLPFKHADRGELAHVLSFHMQRAGAALLDRADFLVPVPLHRRRLRQRRFNQAVLLARALGRRAARPVLPDLLERLHATPALGGATALARAEALRGAIAVRPSRHVLIEGRRMLLIDDVLTSGATANACAQALLDAGASSVDVLVASRVPDPRRAEDTRPDAQTNKGYDDDDADG
jgi:ComF family protein